MAKIGPDTKEGPHDDSVFDGSAIGRGEDDVMAILEIMLTETTSAGGVSSWMFLGDVGVLGGCAKGVHRKGVCIHK